MSTRALRVAVALVLLELTAGVVVFQWWHPALALVLLLLAVVAWPPGRDA